MAARRGWSGPITDVIGPAPRPRGQRIRSRLRPDGLRKWLAGETVLPLLLAEAAYGVDMLYYGPRQHVVHANHPSAVTHPRVIEKYLCAGVDDGGILMMESMETLMAELGTDTLMVHPMGAVEKGGVPLDPKSDVGRVISDQSHGGFQSVNFHIPIKAFPVTTMDRLDRVTEELRRLRRVYGAGVAIQMAKVDVDGAFRTIGVRRADAWLNGKKWTFDSESKVQFRLKDGRYYSLGDDGLDDVPADAEVVTMAGRTVWMSDISVAFGAASSPYHYCLFSNTIANNMRKRGFIVLQYVDDSLIMGVKGHGQRRTCGHAVDTLITALEDMGFRVSKKKLEEEGTPTQRLTYIGIEVDTETMEYRVPPKRLAIAKRLVKDCLGRRTMKVRELMSVVGSLQFCAQVVRPGRLFLRRLYDLMAGLPMHHHVHIDAEARKDLLWWRDLLVVHNGVAAIPEDYELSFEAIDSATDASDLGFGGFSGQGFFYDKWRTAAEREASINARELFAICVLVDLFGDQWRGKRVVLRTDSDVAVKVHKNWSASEGVMAGLLRYLHFASARQGCEVRLRHLAGVLNVASDHASRLRLDDFHAVRPNSVRVQIPARSRSVLAGLLA